MKHLLQKQIVTVNIQHSFYQLSTCQPKNHFGNGKKIVSTTAFEVKCNPDDEALLKRILNRATVNGNMLPGK